jgi:WD40 repeat protein
MPIKVSDFNLRRVLLREERVFLASSGGELFLINITNQSNWEVNKIYQDKNHEIIRDIDIHYDGEILAFTDSGGWLRILNFENDRLCSVMAHNGHAVSVCFNKTGHFLATGGQDNIINLWGFHNGKIKKLFEIHGHRDTVTSLVFNSKNQLFSASRDQSIKQWDLKGLE